MKKIAFLFLTMLLITATVKAAYFEKLPYTITQPDGKIIQCLVSGDEFFNWIHDQEGYTIMQATNGYFYYAEQSGDSVKPTRFLVNSVNPGSVGLKKWAKISQAAYQRIRDGMFSYETSNHNEPSYAPQSGILNNLVLYIRFSNDAEFTTTRQSYDDKFNPATGVSLKSYYKEVSYNLLTINSTHYPACALTTNLSYQDSHPRSYFQPYNATTNPGGYSGGAYGTERTNREHQLLADAINFVNLNSPVSASLNIDGDGDNNIDNVCFIVKGSYDAWAELLWAHRWSLYSQNVYINGKRVYDYTFQPESQVAVTTLCHEMFHTLGAPDLYHYTNQGAISPVGAWDLMESGSGHMTAYMKWKYSNHNWVTTIPEITTTGTYTLNPLTSATNNCYKIASPNSTDEYFMVEYRNKSGTFETNIPGSGLIVYRIDTRVSGNAGGPPDEVYLYRPGGTLTVNGTTTTANFSSTVGRTSINNSSNPGCFLQNGSVGGLNISNVTTAGATISFNVTMPIICTPPTTQATAFSAASISNTSMTIGFTRGNGNSVMVVAHQGSAVNDFPLNGTAYTANASFGSGTQIGTGNYVIYNGSGTSVNVTALTAGTIYYYEIYEYNATPNCYLTPALTGSSTTTGIPPYCTAGALSTTSAEYITNIAIGTINQASTRGSGGYQNYTAQTTNMQVGVSKTVTVKVTNAFAADQVLIWVDWNRDGDFADSGENVYVSSGSFSSPHTSLAFAPPAGTTDGLCRMRIRLHASNVGPNTSPCGNSSYGEVEDYSINVISYPVLTAGISGGTTPICYNTSAGTLFATAAGGTGSYTYLWYKNGVSTGITTQTYAIGNLTVTSTYYCAVSSGSSGTVNTTTKTISITTVPTTASAGSNQNLCGTMASASLGGNTPVNGNGLWTMISGPGTTTFSAPESGSSTALATAYGTYILQWTISNGSCTPSSAQISVSLYPQTIAGTIIATASPILGGQTAEITLSGNTGSITKWQKSIDGGNSWTDIVSTANPYSETANTLGTLNYIAVVKSGVCAEINTAPAIIVVNVNSTTFTGTIDNNWNTAGNWNNGIPTNTDNVTIPANKLIVVNTHSECNNLTIAPLGQLTINTSNDLLVNGTLTLQSDASGSASLIDNGALVTASTIVECYISHTNPDEFHMLASPVVAQAISPDYNQQYGFYLWNEQTGSWIEFADSLNFVNTNNGTNFIPGKAYAVSYPDIVTKNFTGILNKGTINVPLTVNPGTYSGWNFVANPYPSSINWDATSGWTRSLLADANGGGEKAIWVWNTASGNYGAYISNSGNGTNGVTQNLASSQGFWVKAASAGMLCMNNDIREHTSQVLLKSTATTSETIRISVSGSANTYKDEISISYGNASDQGGAEKMFSMYLTAPSLYTTKLNKNWSINYLTDVSQHAMVAIGFKAGADGIYTLNANGLASFTSTYVYLKDLITNTLTDLNQNATYTFTANCNDNANRFQLLLSLSPLKIFTEEIQNNHIYANANTIFVNSDEDIQQIAIYNLLGQLVKTIENTNRNAIITMNENTTAYYIVRVVCNKNVYSEKIRIN